MSPGSQSRYRQIAARVEKRTPLTFPDLSNDRFDSVIPIASAGKKLTRSAERYAAVEKLMADHGFSEASCLQADRGQSVGMAI